MTACFGWRQLFQKLIFLLGGVCQKNVHWKNSQLQNLRNDFSGFDSRRDVTMSISFQIIHCKKGLKNEIHKSFQETSYFWLKIICKIVQPSLFPVFIHWNNLTNHNKPNIKVIISWSIWVVVQTLFKCLSFSLIL